MCAVLKQFTRMVKDRPRSGTIGTPTDSPPLTAKGIAKEKTPSLKSLVSPRGKGFRSKESSDVDSGCLSDASIRSLGSDVSSDHDRWIQDDHRKFLRYGTIDELFSTFIRNQLGTDVTGNTGMLGLTWCRSGDCRAPCVGAQAIFYICGVNEAA